MQRPLFFLSLFAAIGILFWLLFGFFGVQALFINTAVQEELPEIPSSGSALSDTSSPTLLASGGFVQGDSTYTISGSAFLTQESETRTLSFENFSVTNGPDLFVYLVDTSSADNTSVKDAVREGNFINLGQLKGNLGNQNYLLPEGELPARMVISIWCKRFSRNFGAAALVSPIQTE
jgi:hypothetical protein